MIVAIHQPNYAPWLGFFYKVALSDTFVFLDDAQYSRGSYTNRVQIGRVDKSLWLTQPIKREFGSNICDTMFANCDWPARHLDSLKGAYASAAAFHETWPMIRAIWETIPCESLAIANEYIIEGLATTLGLKTHFVLSSKLATGEEKGDERLVQILQAVAPNGGVYLSGKGGANYQTAVSFSEAGYELRYGEFCQTEYQRGKAPFIAGLSVLDALFHCGVDATRKIVHVA